MKPISLILLLLVFLSASPSSFGQIENDLKKALSKKDFTYFFSFTDSLETLGRPRNGHWQFIRDLTNEYSESVFILKAGSFSDSVTCSKWDQTFFVKLICSTKHIIYHELLDLKTSYFDDSLLTLLDTVEMYKEEKTFEDLKASFKTIYKSELREDELFLSDLVYGNFCGIAGSPPNGRELLSQWVFTKNKVAIKKWLTSPNIERQMYAIDGLFQLKRTGSKITKDELDIIRVILNKKGTISVCSGCIHKFNEIGNVAEEFKPYF